MSLIDHALSPISIKCPANLFLVEFEVFQTPPTLSVTPASVHLLPKTPQKLRYHSRLSTPNVAVRIKSPMMSPIQPSSNRSLKFDSAKKGREGGENSFSHSPSPMEKSFHAPLNDHLDLKVVLKEFELSHLLPVFESKGVSYLLI